MIVSNAMLNFQYFSDKIWGYENKMQKLISFCLERYRQYYISTCFEGTCFNKRPSIYNISLSFITIHIFITIHTKSS